jgi:hypothetical protein
LPSLDCMFFLNPLATVVTPNERKATNTLI